jgi:hypothetical protein
MRRRNVGDERDVERPRESEERGEKNKKRKTKRKERSTSQNVARAESSSSDNTLLGGEEVAHFNVGERNEMCGG